MNKNVKNSLGLAQIPLMIVLLLMAIAVPVATKLVQNNADSRNFAKEAGQDCGLGQRRDSSGCVSDVRADGNGPRNDDDNNGVGSGNNNNNNNNRDDRDGRGQPTAQPTKTSNGGGCFSPGGLGNNNCDSGVCYQGKCQTLCNDLFRHKGCGCDFLNPCDDSTDCVAGKCVEHGSPAPTARPTTYGACNSIVSDNCESRGGSVVKNGGTCYCVFPTTIPIPSNVICGSGSNGINCVTRAPTNNPLTPAVMRPTINPIATVEPTVIKPTVIKPTVIKPTVIIACKPTCRGKDSCVDGTCMGPDAKCQKAHPGQSCSASGNSGQCTCLPKPGSSSCVNGGQVAGNCCYDAAGKEMSCRDVVTHTSNFNAVFNADGTVKYYTDVASAINQCKDGIYKGSDGKYFCGGGIGGEDKSTAVVPTKTGTGPGNPTAGPTLPAGQVAMLNYKVAYDGVNPNSAQCVVDWPLQFIVLSSGESKAYVDERPSAKTVVGNKLVFSGSLALDGFSRNTGIAAFIKGSKHIQVKYGLCTNQVDAYNKAGGEITLGTNTSLVCDFSGFPLISGDVVGVNSEAQDGWVNGVDFAYVKAKSLVHETVTAGGYLKGDLDGNCQVNSNDVNLLKISLQEKQGQLY